MPLTVGGNACGALRNLRSSGHLLWIEGEGAGSVIGGCLERTPRNLSLDCWLGGSTYLCSRDAVFRGDLRGLRVKWARAPGLSRGFQAFVRLFVGVILANLDGITVLSVNRARNFGAVCRTVYTISPVDSSIT